MSGANGGGRERNATPTRVVTWNKVLPPVAPYITPHCVVSDIFNVCAHARRGWFGHLHVFAPRGYGKTRLLNEVAAELTHQGDAMVVFAEPSSQGATEGSVLEQVFAQVAAACRLLPPVERDAVRRSALARAGALCGVVASATPTFAGWLGLDSNLRAPAIDVGQSFSRQANVLASVLSILGSAQLPLVLVVDSLDRLDIASRALLDALAGHRHQSTALVTASRHQPSLHEAPDFEHALSAFSISEVCELVQRSLPGSTRDLGRVGETLHTQTHGRPLDCWALLQEWVNRGDLRQVADEWVLSRRPQRAPAPVETLYGRRLSRLSDDAHHLVLGLALSYLPLHEADLTELLGWSPERVSLAVREAVEGAIIQSFEKRLDFNHEIVRERTIDRASKEAISGHHRGLADWVAKRAPSRPAALAFHREHATPAGLDEGLARCHLAAAKQCLDVFDTGRAKWFAERGLARCGRGLERANLMRALADAELLDGDQTAAARAYKLSIDLAPTTEVAVRIASDCVYTIVCRSGERVAREVTLHALRRAGVFRGSSKVHSLDAFVSHTLALLARRPCKEAESLRDAICALASRSPTAFVTEPVGLLTTSVYAIRAARGLQTPDASTARALEGGLLAILGVPKRAETVFLGALQLAERMGSSWHIGAILHQYAHTVLFPADRIKEGVDAIRRGISAFRESGDSSLALVSHLFHAFYTERVATLEERIAILDEGLRLRSVMGDRMQLGVLPVRSLRCLLEFRAGLKPRDDPKRLLQRLDDPDVQRVERIGSALFLADTLLLQGSAREAFVLALTTAESMRGPQVETVCHVYLTVLRAAARCDLDASECQRVKKIERKAKQISRRYRFFARALAEIPGRRTPPGR